ncbi:MAG TPA: hypothetical protein VJX95_04455, partial [Oscillospiraceae bacterium]|nr:hypothetical protein [Oscillospiraceae bacterium]
MNFDEKLKKYINETPVPENLLPENIITMLENEKVSERELTTSHIKIESTGEKTSKITLMPRKRTWVRATAMIAACAVIAVG